MERKLIYLDDAIDAINKRIQFLKDDPVFIRKRGDIDLYGIKPILQTLPSAERKGEWICETDKYYSENVYCSICKSRAPYIYVCNDPYGKDAHGERKKTNFCPNCGADMRGENIC